MSDIKNIIVERAAEGFIPSVANKITYGGGGLALFGGLTSTDIAAYGGLLLAAIGFAFNVYYKIREDRRGESLHIAQMAEWDGKSERRKDGRNG